MREKPQVRRSIAVGELRSPLDAVPAQAPLLVRIHDRYHFNARLGDLPADGVAVVPLAAGRGWSSTPQP
jgi:hypothetical protein